jgi:hypothetical protein
MKLLAAATVFLTALTATPAVAQLNRADSLCRPSEAVLFTCKVGTKVVSICGQEQSQEQGQSGAIYRFGRPGHVELEVDDLHRAHDGWSGGGETQVYADTPTHRYIVYDRMGRIGVDNEGHNIPKFTSGLLVQSRGRMVSSQECALPGAFDQALLRKLTSEGDYVDH